MVCASSHFLSMMIQYLPSFFQKKGELLCQHLGTPWVHLGVGSKSVQNSCPFPVKGKIPFDIIHPILHFFWSTLRNLTLFPMGGGHMAPSAENRPLSVEKGKNENFQKWTVGKSPPHSPQPHLNPTISSYIEEQLFKCLWSEQVACFHLMSSNACVKVKKTQNSPTTIGLMMGSNRGAEE